MLQDLVLLFFFLCGWETMSFELFFSLTCVHRWNPWWYCTLEKLSSHESYLVGILDMHFAFYCISIFIFIRYSYIIVPVDSSCFLNNLYDDLWNYCLNHLSWVGQTWNSWHFLVVSLVVLSASIAWPCFIFFGINILCCYFPRWHFSDVLTFEIVEVERT